MSDSNYKERSNEMGQLEGITHEGLKAAICIKENYRAREPICLPGDDVRILQPENLMNHQIDLQSIEDPLALSMMATRDPEPPMALAAATRLSPLSKKSTLLKGVFQVVGETTKHDLIANCISMITENAFSSESICKVRNHANKYIITSRREYTLALRRNLQALLDGTIAPRSFVRKFFELTQAGNMRSDIRKKLVLSLLLSKNIRPSIKFLFLENFDQLPQPVQNSIFYEVMRAEPSHHMEILKEELRWMASKTIKASKGHLPNFQEAKDLKEREQGLNVNKRAKTQPWIPDRISSSIIKSKVYWQ